MSRKLIDLKQGEEGTILQVSGDECTDLKRHLLGMGFVRGAKIKLEKVAPLGDPYEFKIKGYNVCLRKEEAENILIDDQIISHENSERRHGRHGIHLRRG